MELVPGGGPILAERLGAEPAALGAGGLLAAVPFGRVHADLLDSRHLHGGGQVVVGFEEALPELVLRNGWG